MPRKLHTITLTEDERRTLQALTRKGERSVRQYKRARVLLLADQGLTDPQIAERADISVPSIERIRKRFVQERAQGAEQAITERPHPGRRPIFDPILRAKITALACSDPPEGHAKWSLRLLADKAVELEYVESISHVTIGEILKKTNSRRT